MSLLVPLSLFFAILVVAGGTWIVRRSAQKRPVAEAVAGDPGAESRPRTAMGQLKAMVQRGEWQRALPSLLVIAGLGGVMVFGALALIFVFERTSAGVPMLAIAIFAIVRVALDYYRS